MTPSSWRNPDAGNHPLPEDPNEVGASIRAAERCMDLIPYLRIRYGRRGDAFARTDSGYLTTLTAFPGEYVVEQVRWLAGVLGSRGMPRWLMETHLEILADELAAAIPDRAVEFGKLRDAAAALRRERHAVLPEEVFAAHATAFAGESGDPIPRFGEILMSAVCDEACGIEDAVTSLTSWLETVDSVPVAWRTTALTRIAQGRQLVSAFRV